MSVTVWGCVLTLASGCFTPNCNAQTKTSERSRLHNCKHCFSIYTDIFWIPVYFI